jgi:hypothetical protein
MPNNFIVSFSLNRRPRMFCHYIYSKVKDEFLNHNFIRKIVIEKDEEEKFNAVAIDFIGEKIKLKKFGSKDEAREFIEQEVLLKKEEE